MRFNHPSPLSLHTPPPPPPLYRPPISPTPFSTPHPLLLFPYSSTTLNPSLSLSPITCVTLCVKKSKWCLKHQMRSIILLLIPFQTDESSVEWKNIPGEIRKRGQINEIKGSRMRDELIIIHHKLKRIKVNKTSSAKNNTNIAFQNVTKSVHHEQTSVTAQLQIFRLKY